MVLYRVFFIFYFFSMSLLIYFFVLLNQLYLLNTINLMIQILIFYFIFRNTCITLVFHKQGFLASVTWIRASACMSVIPAVFYLSAGLAGCSVGSGISCGGRKLARTSRVKKKKSPYIGCLLVINQVLLIICVLSMSGLIISFFSYFLAMK